MSEKNTTQPTQEGEEKLSKNAQKKLEKQKQKEAEKASKAAAKAAKQASEPAQKETKKSVEEAEEELDPTQYTENRKKAIEAYGENVYPHKFQVTLSVPEFVAKYSYLGKDTKLESDIVSIAGRIYVKRSAGSGLVFYDLKAEGAKLQILCDKRHYKDEKNFDRIHDLLRRGDIVGVKGFPARAKSKAGELSIIPLELQLLSPCLHMLPTLKGPG